MDAVDKKQIAVSLRKAVTEKLIKRKRSHAKNVSQATVYIYTYLL